MMLNSDMCLVYRSNREHAKCMTNNHRQRKMCKNEMRKGTHLNAKKDNCCTWRGQFSLNHGKIIGEHNDRLYCGMDTATLKEATNFGVM